MRTGIPIVAAGALVALAILLTNHWTMTTPAHGIGSALRLNRWTGEMEICEINPGTMPNPNSMVGAKVECRK